MTTTSSMQISAEHKQQAAADREASTARQPSNIPVQGINRTSTVSMAEVQPQSGILGTTRTSTGSPTAASRLKPDSTIEIQGTRMTLKVAERLGFVTRTRDGYQEVGQAQPALASSPQDQQQPAPEARQPQQEQQASSPDALPAEAETLRNAIMHEAPGAVVGNTFNNVLEGVIRNEADIDLSELQTAMGFNTKQATEAFSGLRDGFQAQANAAATSVGVNDVDALWTWARANKPHDVRAALSAQLEGRGAEGYRKIAKAFLRATRG